MAGGRTPNAGDVVKDLRRDELAQFQVEIDGQWWLRPIGGGHEWGARPDDVRRATYAETKRARRVVEQCRERAAQMMGGGA